MQVLKKFWLLFGLFVLAGCDPYHWSRSDQIVMTGGYENRSDSTFQAFETGDVFKTAMLLPLSGKAAAYGQGMKNAAMMAIEDADNPQLVVRFYDTRSTAAGAETAVQQALADGSRLILGPLTSEEVSAAAPLARRHDIPLISFSTAPQVLQNGVYTLGLLGSEQVERIVGYASGQGRSRLAVLVPDSASGMNTAKATVQSARRHGMEVVKIGFYPPETLDFAGIVKSLTDYETRSGEINRQKAELSKKAKEGDRAAQKELNKLKTVYTTGEVDFDTVLIAESGNRLKSAAAMFGYYDIYYPDVLFLGTSTWENTGLTKESTLYQAVYPVLSRVHNDYFNKKYQNLFGQSPNLLYSFAYDSVALASALSRKNHDALAQNITDPDGFIGINGTFRIYDDGTNRHSLDVVKVTSGGIKVVDQAPQRLNDNFGSDYDIYRPVFEQQPQIFGKEPESVYQILYGNNK